MRAVFPQTSIKLEAKQSMKFPLLALQRTGIRNFTFQKLILIFVFSVYYSQKKLEVKIKAPVTQG